LPIARRERECDDLNSHAGGGNITGDAQR
jgi:hypothetical protein